MRTDALIKTAKDKSKKRESEVISAIEQMKADKEDINYASVSRRTGASKTYLYHNPRINKIILEERSRENKVKTYSVPELLHQLELKNREIEELKRELSAYKSK